jgi:SAM-dependent methyltransferase
MPQPHDFAQRWFPNEPCATGAFHAVIDRLAPVRGRILDVGCGANDLLARHRTRALQVWGTDFERHPDLKHAEWFRPLHADGTLPFANESFDMLCSHMVMEHVTDPERFLAEVARTLKAGGCYVGHSIHACHYVTWIRRLFNLVPHRCVQRLVKTLYGREEHDTFPTHYRMNSRRALTGAANSLGFDWVLWEQYANQGYFSFLEPMRRAAVLFDWALEQASPGLGKIYFTAALRKPAYAGALVVSRAA